MDPKGIKTGCCRGRSTWLVGAGVCVEVAELYTRPLTHLFEDVRHLSPGVGWSCVFTALAQVSVLLQGRSHFSPNEPLECCCCCSAGLIPSPQRVTLISPTEGLPPSHCALHLNPEKTTKKECCLWSWLQLISDGAARSGRGAAGMQHGWYIPVLELG